MRPVYKEGSLIYFCQTPEKNLEIKGILFYVFIQILSLLNQIFSALVLIERQLITQRQVKNYKSNQSSKLMESETLTQIVENTHNCCVVNISLK